MSGSNLRKRVFSASIILLILLLATVFFKARGFFVIGLIVCAGGIFEYTQLVLRSLNQKLWVTLIYVLLSLSLLAAGAFGSPQQSLFIFFGFLPFFAAIALWSKRTAQDIFSTQPFVAYSALGFIYAALIPGITLHLLFSHQGVKWFSLLLIVVFVGDIAAYFGGSILKGPKLMPLVSPNKTISGAICGLCASSGVGVFAIHWLHLPVSMIVAFFICLTANLLAQSGDLFESLLKRVSNVKDSGYFLAGHGGVLDRLDGVYFAAPVILCAAHWFS